MHLPITASSSPQPHPQDHFATIPGGTSFRRRVERAHMVAGTQDVADPEPRFAQPSSAQPGGAHGAEGGGGGERRGMRRRQGTWGGG